MREKSMSHPLFMAVHSQGLFTRAEYNNIVKNGMHEVVNGFRRYDDVASFFSKYRRDIIKSLGEMAQILGMPLVDMVQEFWDLGHITTSEIANTLYGLPDDFNRQVAHSLAWYAVLAVARDVKINPSDYALKAA